MSVHQEPATALPREHPDLQVGVYRGRIPLDFAKTASEPQLGPILGVSGKAHPSHVDPGKPFYAETEDPDLEQRTVRGEALLRNHIHPRSVSKTGALTAHIH